MTVLLLRARLCTAHSLASLLLPRPPTPGFLLGDPASQTPQEVPEPECLPRIIFNGFLGCSPG